MIIFDHAATFFPFSCLVFQPHHSSGKNPPLPQALSSLSHCHSQQADHHCVFIPAIRRPKHGVGNMHAITLSIPLCIVYDSVKHIGSCNLVRVICPSAQAIGVFARVLPHVPANKSQRRDGSPGDGHLDGVAETHFILASTGYTIWVGAHQGITRYIPPPPTGKRPWNVCS
ncbi:hypothetical protein HaLaN_03184 [Haematococcus lacustris]|uniref:Uncharacterized protein n=1 Tax=Haematococcus lacustris TaxID=44745 RepID=A0A699YFK7_HAELA|nr:hypothetical protein HaLaN_03184 [Haematococcus lacustris]